MAEGKRVYRGVPEWSRAEAEAALASGDADAVRDALLSISFHDPDWRYAQDTCLRHVDDPLVCEAATIALAHIGRVHGRIDPEKVVPALVRIRGSGSPAAGNAETAIGDLRQFVPAARPLIAELDGTAERLADALVGGEVHAVAFVLDYVRLHLSLGGAQVELSIWNPLTVRQGTRHHIRGQPGWRDALCSLIEREVLRVDVRAGEQLGLAFTGGAALTVSLRPDDYRSAEAVYVKPNGRSISL